MKQIVRSISAIILAVICGAFLAACANGGINPPVKEPPVTVSPVTTDAPLQTTEQDVTTETPATTETPVTTEAPVTTEPPVTTEAPVTIEAPVTTEVPVTTEASVSDKDDVPTVEAGVYSLVLSGIEKYSEDGREQYLTKKPGFAGFKLYTLVDMDGDGDEECLVGSQQYVLVLYSIENKIYGYTFGFRAMDTVYEDGTFSHHGFVPDGSGTESAGLSRITEFTVSSPKVISILRVDGFSSDAVKYYIGEENKEVTKAEYEAYAAQYYGNKVDLIDF